MKILLTGANSSVGKRLLGHIAQRTDLAALACVRHENALASLTRADNVEGRIIDYREGAALAEALRGVQCVVHLAGILIESRASSYREANVQSTAAVVDAARKGGAGHIVLASVLGADPASSNPYYRSKGEAEELAAGSGIPATILRTPLLLGPGTAGARALLNSASAGRARVLGGGYYRMRPLDVDDLCRVILRSCENPPETTAFHELAGPEMLSYRQLIERTAARLGKGVRFSSVPLWMAGLAAALGSRLRGGGITPAVIEVITSDEVAAGDAAKALGVTLTPLDETLDKIINER